MEKDYTSATFINLSMGSLGIIGKDSINLHKLLKATNMDKSSIAYCIKKLSACCMFSVGFVWRQESDKSIKKQRGLEYTQKRETASLLYILKLA